MDKVQKRSHSGKKDTAREFPPASVDLSLSLLIFLDSGGDRLL
jgi:hypothetical protein